MKTTMVATKAFRYATRAMMAGDYFEASRRDAKILTAVGKAEVAKPRQPVEVPAPPVVVKPDVDDLRAKAEALGIKVDARWGVPRLTTEIAAAES